MKKKIMKKWVKALRSGDYKQTTGCLKDDTGYCCLGVLCDIYRKDQKKGFNFLNRGTLNETVMKWSGVKTDEGIIGDELEYGNERLIEMNDFYKKSFKQIAKVIEKNYENL